MFPNYRRSCIAFAQAFIFLGSVLAGTGPALRSQVTFGDPAQFQPNVVAVDRDGNTYVAGSTSSADFPVVGALQPNLGGQPLRLSLDQGSTWTSPAIPAPVTAVASSAKRPSVVFAGTLRGLFKSVDGGKTWNALPAPSSSPFQINAIVADPDNPDILNVATTTGEYKSADAGQTWHLTAGGPGVVLASSAARPSTLFTVSNSNLYRTTDGAAHWALVAGAPNGSINTIACDPVHPDIAYLIVFKDYSNQGLYKTSDGGDTWTKLSSLEGSYSTQPLAVSADGTVYLSTSKGIEISRDGGTTWSQTPVKAEAPYIAADPTNPRIVYAGTGVILRTSDGGISWTTVMPVRQYVSALAVLPGNGNTSVFVGANRGQNLFITKWNAGHSQILYSTYLGGSFSEAAAAIAVDGAGNTYVTGYTSSTDFPTTSGALQLKNAGDTNAFLAKINPQGDKLLYSTYLGGSTADAATTMTLDGSGNVYLAGYASSPDFPSTSGGGPKQGCASTLPSYVLLLNQGDAFVAKIDIDTGQLMYSTLVGGTCAEQAMGVAVDSSGNAIVVGVTDSPDFPITGDALEKSHSDANVVTGFLVKLSSNGSMLFATYLGGPAFNTAESIAMDAHGDIYVSGSSQGFDSIQFGRPPSTSTGGSAVLSQARFPISRSFTYPMPSVGAAYVLKLRPDTWNRLYLKYLGGTSGEGKDIAVDNGGRAWVTGGAGELAPSDAPFPLVHPFQAIGDSFVTQLSPDGSGILFSSRAFGLGGLALDRSGDVLVAGEVTVVIPCPSPGPGLSCLSFQNTVQLTRVDADVASAITVDEPQRFVPITDSNLHAEGVTAGELVIITGTGLGPKETISAQLTPDGKLSTSLAGTQVTFNGMPAPLISVEEGRIVCITPLATGVSLPVTSPEGIILGTIVMRVESVNGNATMRIGTLPSAVGVLAVVNADGSVNSPAHPTGPGAILTVYAEGFGIEPFAVDGEISKAASLLFFQPMSTATIGGAKADIVYIGSAPGQVAGVVQINVRVPAQLAPGTYSAMVGLTGASFAPQADAATFSLYIGQH